MSIIYIKTKLGADLPDLVPGNARDAGVDVRAAKTVWLWPFRRKLIPLGFVYRFLPREPVFRDGAEWIRAMDVEYKGSGPEKVKFQAIKFDEGYQHEIEDPEGVSLVAVNTSIFPMRIRRGMKIAQLVVIEVQRPDWRLSTAEELRKIPRPDNRGSGRVGSTG